jgi:chromosome partitioning protein
MVIAIASQKGGSGKTTTSLEIAAGIGLQNKKVLLIDLDSQANSSKVLISNYLDLKPEDTTWMTIIQRRPLPIHETNFKNVWVAPAHILMSETDLELTTAMDHREARLKSQLAHVVNQFDHVIIDCPPTLGWLTLNAFTAATGVVVPVAPGYFELDSLTQISKTIAKVKEDFNPDIELLGLLFTMSDPTVASNTTIKILRETHGDNLLKTVIPRNTDIRDAHFNKQDIFTASPNSKAAHAYQKLITELGL